MAVKFELADYSQLKQWLAQSKQASENNSLYQCIFNLIGGVDALQKAVGTNLSDLQAQLQGITAVNVYEFDTNGPVPAFDLDTLVGLGVFKDCIGNAAVNNIVLTGTVEGVVNPTINTNFGFFKIYKSTLSSPDLLFWG
jgi:hypothetical protein